MLTLDPSPETYRWHFAPALSLHLATKFGDDFLLWEFSDVTNWPWMAHWYEVFSHVHVTFGAVRGPKDVIDDPQLRVNDIIVPLEGAGGKLTSTISGPIRLHGFTKVSAKRAPELGEHTTRCSSNWGSARPISMACAQAVPFQTQRVRQVAMSRQQKRAVSCSKGAYLG